MVTIDLKQFQIDAIVELHKAMAGDRKNIILKSGTGSGKTVILTSFADEFMRENSGYVTLWFCPGKGNLEEQSKKKMEMYIPNSTTKMLQDVLNMGFNEGDAIFINWELVTKTGNRALSEGEQKNLFDVVERATEEGLKFLAVIDEEHLNKTVKADDIIKLFNPVKTIRASATPEKDPNSILIEIPEERVIAAGLIKKLIIINEGIDDEVSMSSQVEYLLDLALKKQEQLREAFFNEGSNVNPLIIVQIPNNSESLIDSVEQYFDKRGLNYFNKELAVWLADKKENLDHIEDNTCPVRAVIIKQAVATGWDCPRAHILVKLRENMSETFEIQTIGRIRRMPEARHYENTLLDNCYLYTFDEKFKEGVKLHLGKEALEAKTVFLKGEYRDVELKKEKISVMTTEINPVFALEAFINFFKKDYSLKAKDYTGNRKLISAFGYDLDNNVKLHTYKGEISTIRKKELSHLNQVIIKMLLDTHEHGRMFHHAIGEIGRSSYLKYDKMSVILRKLFCIEPKYNNKLLDLTPKELYAFVINNSEKLENDFLKAMSSDKYKSAQLMMAEPDIVEDYYLPRELLFTYDKDQKHVYNYDRNVYEGYLSTAEPRSQGERMFEQFCEDYADWFFKNGDKGNEYFSIVYSDNSGIKRHFYPDYIVGIGNDMWIVETKGGESAYGKSEDIDKFTDKKMQALVAYSKEYNLKCGIVRLNKADMRLYISTTKYTEDMEADCWMILKEVILKEVKVNE